MQPIRALFFDIGDTLVFDDPPLRERFQTAMQQSGRRYPATLFADAFHLGEQYAIGRYLEGLPFDMPHVLRECADCIISALALPPLTETQWAALAQAFAAVPFTRFLHPQALDLIQTLRSRGFQIGVISDWEETLPDLLAELALAPHLDALAVSALVGVTKPNSLLFQDALQQLNMDPAQTLHIGDWYELDVAGARAAGMSALLFDHAGRAPHADCPRVQTFDEMSDFLLALPAPCPEAPYPASPPFPPQTVRKASGKDDCGSAQNCQNEPLPQFPQEAQGCNDWPLSLSEGGGVAKPGWGFLGGSHDL